MTIYGDIVEHAQCVFAFGVKDSAEIAQNKNIFIVQSFFKLNLGLWVAFDN